MNYKNVTCRIFIAFHNLLTTKPATGITEVWLDYVGTWHMVCC